MAPYLPLMPPLVAVIPATAMEALRCAIVSAISSVIVAIIKVIPRQMIRTALESVFGRGWSLRSVVDTLQFLCVMMVIICCYKFIANGSERPESICACPESSRTRTPARPKASPIIAFHGGRGHYTYTTTTTYIANEQRFGYPDNRREFVGQQQGSFANTQSGNRRPLAY